MLNGSATLTAIFWNFMILPCEAFAATLLAAGIAPHFLRSSAKPIADFSWFSHRDAKITVASVARA
jgi:hypothetical protein